MASSTRRWQPNWEIRRQTIKSELLYPKRLVFKSENLYFSCMEESLRLGEKMMGNGAELLEKKRTKQKKPKKPRGRGDAFD